MRSWRVDWLMATMAAIFCATQAHAQSNDGRLYLGLLAGPYHTTADHVDGTLSSIGVTGGVRMTPWLDLEVDVDPAELGAHRRVLEQRPAVATKGPHRSEQLTERGRVAGHACQ